MVLIWILASTFLVSVISLVGIFTLAIKEKMLNSILFCLIGFSAGSLMGGAFLHIIPEALEAMEPVTVFYLFILGYIIFLFLEKYFYWRHCHNGVCDFHAFTYLNLIGDGVHNFIDGMVIASSFTVSVNLGIVTTIAVVLHEIPQELGDFGVLIYGGFSRKKALIANFICALTAVVGSVIGYFLSGIIPSFSQAVLPVVAGGFTYIATSDLIPEIHKETNQRRATLALAAFLLGIAFMIVAKGLFKE